LADLASNLRTVSWGDLDAPNPALLVCTVIEVEDTNHYDILYSAPKITVEAISGSLTDPGKRQTN
jgi:hypothetical protein